MTAACDNPRVSDDNDKRGRLILLSDLDTDAARAAAGHAIAALEEDCSASWPTCPRGGLLCDCRLRAVRALNSVRLLLGNQAAQA